METVQWIIRIILALIFFIAGIVKISLPTDRLVRMATWTSRFAVPTVRLIGIVELIGAAGLILPLALNMFPFFEILAAVGLALVMILASFHHINHREYRPVIITITLMVLSVFVAFTRIEMLL